VNKTSLQLRLVSWLFLALAFGLAANVVWALVQPLILPLACLLVVGVAAPIGFRYWRSRHFW
jgi:uncharacterized membrane protein